MSSDKLVPLGSSFNAFFAHVIRGKLEANDIECHLFDTESFNAMSHLSLAIGGIRIMVLESDLEKAQALVKEAMAEENKAD
tara:strand:- start:696 stop:938 length:243 start_codon:yes stop_codon:yes gene_type:complete